MSWKYIFGLGWVSLFFLAMVILWRRLRPFPAKKIWRIRLLAVISILLIAHILLDWPFAFSVHRDMESVGDAAGIAIGRDLTVIYFGLFYYSWVTLLSHSWRKLKNKVKK